MSFRERAVDSLNKIDEGLDELSSKKKVNGATMLRFRLQARMISAVVNALLAIAIAIESATPEN